LRNRFPEFKYVTLDDLDCLAWARRDPKGFVASLGEAAIIDEIQREPVLTVAVKHAIDTLGCRFFMTGSSTAGLLDAASDSLAGRMRIVSLPSGVWGEERGPATHRLLDDKVDISRLRQADRSLDDALDFGQFPEVVTQSTAEGRKDILRMYRDTYFTRDLMQLANIENLDGLLALYHGIATSIGSPVDISHLARESGLSFPTTKKYLGALSASQLTCRLLGYQYGPAKRYIRSAKLYFADTGILKALGARIGHGQLLENFVVGEFEKRRKLGMLAAPQLYHYRSIGGREVDLVFEIGDSVVAIEIKATKSPGPRDVRNLREFGERADGKVSCFLFYCGDKYVDLDGVSCIPVSALFRASV